MESQWICFLFVYFSITLSALPCTEKPFPSPHTYSNHDKRFGMLTQWFCITHNSTSPVLPPIWDRLAPEAEAELELPVCSSSTDPSVPARGRLCRSSAVSRSMTVQTKGERCSSNRHFYPPPALTSLQVWGSVCLAGCLSLYIPLLVVCCPNSPHLPPLNPPSPITHTLWQTWSSETICVVFALVIIITTANSTGSS